MEIKNGEPADIYINRELSWLEFNRRVLEEAEDMETPLLERLKFLAIVSSNLDEFFMVRVGSLLEQMEAGINYPDPAGLTLVQQLKLISEKTYALVADQYRVYSANLHQQLREQGIKILSLEQLTDAQMQYLDNYYQKTVFPVLTPIVVDSYRSFPLLRSRTLNIALLLQGQAGEGEMFATVQVPTNFKRLQVLPDIDSELSLVWLEDIVKKHLKSLFKGHKIIAVAGYRVLRNADMELNEDEDEDLLRTIQQSLKERKWGAVVRLEIEQGMDLRLLDILRKRLEIDDDAVYEINGPIDLTPFSSCTSWKGYEQLTYPSLLPSYPAELHDDEKGFFEILREKDILLHHPFDSFEPVVEFFRKAASDDAVLAIKATLYRVSGNSPVVAALEQAAEKGKQVTVLVELKARFDEEKNIEWAMRLERAGCHVIYGLVGLKTHSKICLVIRQEGGGIKRYVHFGTGNYNDVTARIYTDIGLFTANASLAADASAVFNMLTGYTRIEHLYRIDLSPLTLKRKVVGLIKKEAQNARKGEKAAIIAKMNSLVDRDIIYALYDAGRAGVQIDLIVRGICCLRPGVKGQSENITVKSIVGRYLEHSRLFYFYNSGNELVYLSSADWMERNMERRVEVMVPLEDERLKQRVKNILDIYLLDTKKARNLNSDGTYTRAKQQEGKPFDSQEYFSSRQEKEERKIRFKARL